MSPPDQNPGFPGISLEDCVRRLAAEGVARVHAVRIWSAVHRRALHAFPALPHLPAGLAGQLGGWFSLRPPAVLRTLESSDGDTCKWLLDFGGGAAVETVAMSFNGRRTACISSQAGCAMGCVFCATGQGGLVRNLTAGEIVSQAHHVVRSLAARGEKLRNIVVMGMGEPLHNYDAVAAALDILCDRRGLALAARRLTLSTVGVVPGIRRLAAERRPWSLAVSLHATTDAERNALVPAGRRWPLAELMDACRAYSASLGRRIFFEWALIGGVNDSDATAARLAALLHGQHAQVNLIPLNPTPGYPGAAPSMERVRGFQRVLRAAGIPATVRQRRGLDVSAGCGQLAAPGTAL